MADGVLDPPAGDVALHDLFRGGFLLQCADYGRELHVLLRHDSIDHVAYETHDRLVGMGRNPPQKDSSCLSSFAAIVVSYMPLPRLFVQGLRNYSEDHSDEATLALSAGAGRRG